MLYNKHDCISSTTVLKSTNRAPTKRPYAFKARAYRVPSFHTPARQEDQIQMSAMSVGRESTGATIGIVFLPKMRSPSMSLKSVAWYVVP